MLRRSTGPGGTGLLENVGLRFADLDTAERGGGNLTEPVMLAVRVDEEWIRAGFGACNLWGAKRSVS